MVCVKCKIKNHRKSAQPSWTCTLTPKSVKNQNSRKFQISFYTTLKNKWYHAKVLPKGFHLIGDNIEFRRQT